MEENGKILQSQGGASVPLAEYPLVVQSVARAYLPSMQQLTIEQRQMESALRAELETLLTEQHELDLQLAVAKKKAENEAIRRSITLFQRIAHSCERCHFPFNVLKEDGTLEARARADKHVCGEGLGDPECIKEQQTERDKLRRAEKKTAE